MAEMNLSWVSAGLAEVSQALTLGGGFASATRWCSFRRATSKPADPFCWRQRIASRHSWCSLDPKFSGPWSGKADRQLPHGDQDGVEDAQRGVRGVSCELDVPSPLEQHLDERRELSPGQTGPETEVDATTAEGELRVRAAAMSKRKGSTKMSESRLAEGYHIVTRSPSAIVSPRIWVSRVARRAKHETGDDHRRISSTARGIASGTRRRCSSWAGWSSSARSPRETAFRVVSLPAMMSRIKNMSSSISLRAVRSPSSVSTSPSTRSSRRHPADSPASPAPVSGRIRTSRPGFRGTHPATYAALGHLLAACRSPMRRVHPGPETGMPTMSAITFIGSL